MDRTGSNDTGEHKKEMRVSAYIGWEPITCNVDTKGESYVQGSKSRKCVLSYPSHSYK